MENGGVIRADYGTIREMGSQNIEALRMWLSASLEDRQSNNDRKPLLGHNIGEEKGILHNTNITLMSILVFIIVFSLTGYVQCYQMSNVKDWPCRTIQIH